MKILMIGNSYTMDTLEHVQKIAQSAGVKDLYIAYLYIGGTSLKNHADNARADSPAYEYFTNCGNIWNVKPNVSIKTALSAQKWDYIGLQQLSWLAGQTDSLKELDYLIPYIKANVPADCNPQFIWNFTWAYPPFCTVPEYNSLYKGDSAKMYECNLKVLKEVILKDFSFKKFCPAGTAVENAKTSYLGYEGIYRDEVHLTKYFGRYMAGLTFAGAILGIPLEKVTYAPGFLSEREKRVALESAANAVNKPFEITRSAYNS